MVTVETVSIVFTGLSVSLAAFYYISTLRNAQRTRELALKAQEQALETRQAQMFLEIWSLGRTPEMMRDNRTIRRFEWENYDDFMEKYGPESDFESWRAVYYVLGYYEGVGVLVRRKLIDVSMVDDFMSSPILSYWEKFEPFWIEFRERRNRPAAAEQTEYLYNEVRRIYEQEHPKFKL